MKTSTSVRHGADSTSGTLYVGNKPRHFFDGLEPVVYAAALYGLVPIGLRPMRVCFDPRRSTLLYAVLIQGLVFWSVVAAWQGRVPGIKKLAEEATKFEDWAQKFVAAHSMGHLMSWLIVPTLWIEAPNIERLDIICRTLMGDFGYLLAGVARPRKVMMWLIAVAVLVPLQEVSWMAFVEFSFDAAANAPVHVYLNEVLVFGVIMPTLCCKRVRTFATNLARLMRRELLRGRLTAPRVVMFRHAWLRLSDLNCRLIATPASLCMVMSMFVFLITLHLYEGLEKLTSNKSESGFLEIIVGLPYLLQLFLLCDIPHRSAEAIREQFLDVLQMPFTHLVDSRTCQELHRFLEIVRWNSSTTVVSNDFHLKRASFNAIMAVTFTYSMLMLQFHLSFNSPCRPVNVSQSEGG